MDTKSIVALLVTLFSVTAALAQQQPWQQRQCGRAEQPSPNGCIRVCPPGDYHIGKGPTGTDTCLRDGNATVTAHTKYGFVSLTEHNTTDNICFGIRPDETTVDTVVDDRFVDKEWHAPNSQIWVAEISYTLDPALTKLHVRAARYYQVDQNKKIVGVSNSLPEDVMVPLYDAPQANWPCTKQQWATIMAEPKYTAVPPGYGDPYASHPGGGGAPIIHAPSPSPTPPPCQQLPLMSRYGSGCRF